MKAIIYSAVFEIFQKWTALRDLNNMHVWTDVGTLVSKFEFFINIIRAGREFFGAAGSEPPDKPFRTRSEIISFAIVHTAQLNVNICKKTHSSYQV